MNVSWQEIITILFIFSHLLFWRIIKRTQYQTIQNLRILIYKREIYQEKEETKNVLLWKVCKFFIQNSAQMSYYYRTVLKILYENNIPPPIRHHVLWFSLPATIFLMLLYIYLFAYYISLPIRMCSKFCFLL